MCCKVILFANVYFRPAYKRIFSKLFFFSCWIVCLYFILKGQQRIDFCDTISSYLGWQIRSKRYFIPVETLSSRRLKATELL